MMVKILKAYDVPPRLLAAINKLYENTRARVITPDGETEFFQIIARVLQGDTLAPYIFAIVLDYVMRKTYQGREEELGFHLQKRQSQRVPQKIVTDLDFADDLALITEEISGTRGSNTPRTRSRKRRPTLQCKGNRNSSIQP